MEKESVCHITSSFIEQIVRYEGLTLQNTALNQISRPTSGVTVPVNLFGSSKKEDPYCFQPKRNHPNLL